MSEAPSQLRIEDDGPVRHLVLNRPEQLNALTPMQHERLIQALAAAEADPRVRMVVLSGAGRAFCAGDDLKGAADWPARLAKRRVALDIGVGPLLLNEATAALRDFPKPTAALLHGVALGAGYDYASSCDFRLATADCRIGDPRIKLGLWGAEGWSYKLPRLLSQTYVAPLTYAGEPIDGAHAAEIGFVHRLYPAGADLRAAARDLLRRIAAIDAEAFRRTKGDLLRGLDQTYAQAVFAY